MNHKWYVVGAVWVFQVAYAIDITSFSSEGVIVFETAHNQGLVTAEKLCDLASSNHWTEVARVSVTGQSSSITVPLCDNEAYYRVRYFDLGVVEGSAHRANKANKAAPGDKNPAVAASDGNKSDNTMLMAAQVATQESSESAVAIKAPGDDEFVMLEEARRNIVIHWNMIYPQPLTFTNAPGSQEDLQDLANALNKLSGQFHRVN